MRRTTERLTSRHTTRKTSPESAAREPAQLFRDAGGGRGLQRVALPGHVRTLRDVSRDGGSGCSQYAVQLRTLVRARLTLRLPPTGIPTGNHLFSPRTVTDIENKFSAR